MSPNKGVFFIFLSEVELGNKPIISCRIEDSTNVLAELKSRHVFIEAFCKLVSLLHLSQVPKHYSLGSSSCKDEITNIEGIEFASRTFIKEYLRLKVWMEALLRNSLLSHRVTVPSVPALTSSLSVNFRLSVLSVFPVGTRKYSDGSYLLMRRNSLEVSATAIMP
jgi:hypothetical protein